MAREINLVPDIKNEFIKTLKFRNFVFFLCIVVASASTVVMLIFLSISGGQQGFIAAKQGTISLLEKKITGYSELSDFLTFRDQLGNISAITENKLMMSRIFNVLSAIIPRGEDTINISELSVELSNEEGIPNFNFEAQADSSTPPYIDYIVLDSFKKSMNYMRYDYGEYVDKNGQTIPSYCMVEKSTDGSVFKDTQKGYYAYWLIQGEGCNPSAEDEEEETEDNTSDDDSLLEDDEENETETETSESNTKTETAGDNSANNLTKEQLSAKLGYVVEDYNGQNVVKIWRTPQYVEWYKSDPKDDEVYMDLDGSIHNIAHFNSSCIKYSGAENENSKSITWTAVNDECKLIPDGSDGITIKESSNGRDAEGGGLVLRFSATLNLAPEFFLFNNHHMLALSPTGYHNVTDSYAQIQSIFVKRASDCTNTDTECITTPTSSDNNSNNSNNNSNNNGEGDEV